VFEISADDIVRLPQDTFDDVMNHLLQADIALSRAPLSCVQTTDRGYVKDGGVDARVNLPGASGSNYLPNGPSVWQYKSGDKQPGQLKTEVAGASKVLDAVRQGTPYRVAIGHDLNPHLRENREAAIQTELSTQLRRTVTQEQRILTASDIARWCNLHPAVLQLPCFGRPYGNLLTHEAWTAARGHGGVYERDWWRYACARTIRTHCTDADGAAHVHIYGKPGVGTTRFALEALRDDGVRSSVLYALDEDQIPQQLFHWVGANRAHLILVVDNCDAEALKRLLSLVVMAHGCIKLITIGANELPLDVDFSASIEVPILTLSQSHTLRLISMLEGVDYTTSVQESIADLSGGYPKFAISLHAAVLRNPHSATLWKNTDIDRVVETLLDVYTSKEQQVLHSLSLLTWVSFGESSGDDADALADFVSMSCDEWRTVAGRLRHRDYLAQHGRAWHVTPNLLAVWLARRMWETHSGRIETKLLGRLTPDGRLALLSRLGDLAGVPAVVEYSRAQLRELLSRADDPNLTGDDIALLASYVAVLEPNEVKDMLRSQMDLLTPLPAESNPYLDGKPVILLTLASIHLAQSSNGFQAAEQLLYQLVERTADGAPSFAENAWVALFRLSNLEVARPSARVRLEFLTRDIASQDLRRRRLVVRGIAKALSPLAMHAPHDARDAFLPFAVSNDDRQGVDGGDATEADRVAAARPIDEALVVALDALRALLSDHDDTIVQEARKILLASAPGLIERSLFDGTINLLEFMPVDAEKNRDRLHACLEDVARGVHPFTESQAMCMEKRLLEVTGSVLRFRLCRWLGVQREDADSAREEERLADDVISRPSQVRDTDWAWLMSASAANLAHFSWYLVLQREMTRSRMKGDGGHEEGQRCRSRCGSSSRTSGI